MSSVFISLVSLFVSFSLFASDHIDGAPSWKNPQADLTDFYAFKTPNKNNNLTLILNVYPGARKRSHFSSKVNYEIQVRPNASTLNSIKILCAFEDPGHHHGSGDPAKVECNFIQRDRNLASLQGEVGEVITNGNLKLFTGPRADAFFLSVPHFQGVTERKGFPAQDTDGDNAMYSLNVLSMAFEIDFSDLGIEPSLLAMSAQSVNASTGHVIDRVGRPEITNLSLHAYDEAKGVKRDYNQVRHFTLPIHLPESFRQRLNDNISAYDQLDGKNDWSLADLDQLTATLISDYLLLDMQKECLGTSKDYLAIEINRIKMSEIVGCGGRKPADDIMAVMSGLYVGGLDANFADYLSGINSPYHGDQSKQLSEHFPYLAAPGRTTVKQRIFLNLFMLMQE